MFIEPDTSMRNTRFARGRLSGSGSQPLIPLCSSRVSGFQGVGKTDIVGLQGLLRQQSLALFMVIRYNQAEPGKFSKKCRICSTPDHPNLENDHHGE